jgi:hypothetical protein
MEYQRLFDALVWSLGALTVIVFLGGCYYVVRWERKSVVDATRRFAVSRRFQLIPGKLLAYPSVTGTCGGFPFRLYVIRGSKYNPTLTVFTVGEDRQESFQAIVLSRNSIFFGANFSLKGLHEVATGDEPFDTLYGIWTVDPDPPAAFQGRLNAKARSVLCNPSVHAESKKGPFGGRLSIKMHDRWIKLEVMGFCSEVGLGHLYEVLEAMAGGA